MKNQSIISLLALALCGVPSHAAVEVHHVVIQWEHFSEFSPFEYSATPVPLFDPQGGERRLGMVRFIITNRVESTIGLDNPLPVRQCMLHEDLFEAYADPSVWDFGFYFEALGPLAQNDRLGAEPMQVATKELLWTENVAFSIRKRSIPQFWDDAIGVGMITFNNGGGGGGHSTWRMEDANPVCGGGFRNGPPFGFFVSYARVSMEITWEYHWIPSSCPVDLTTLSTPGSQFYGEPDGIVDSHDFFYYLDQFALGNLAVADLTTNARPGLPGYGVPNGAITNDDFFYFLLKYVEGC